MLRSYSCVCLLTFLVSLVSVHGRAYCYTGSNLYQLAAQDCQAESNYNGTWFCAKMEICESFINSKRVCAITRGCATQEQCTRPSGAIYNGEVVQVNGTYPGGMNIELTCCASYSTANDDTVELNYADICNSALSSATLNFSFIALSILVVSFVSLMM